MIKGNSLFLFQKWKKAPSSETAVKRSFESDDDGDEDWVPGSSGSDAGSEEIEIIPLQHYSLMAQDSDDDTYQAEDDRLRDRHYKDIYIRKIMKNKVAFGGQVERKKGDRVYNAYHACYYCNKLVQHIPIHMKTHRNISEVKEILADPNSNFDELRRRGDDKHNRAVVEERKGEIVGLAKRPKDDVLDITLYGPCPHCALWVLIKHVKQHYKKCSKINATSKIDNKKLVLQVQIMAGHITSNPSDLLKEEVFSSMKNDDVGMVAKNDDLIVALGESWLRRNLPNVEKRKYYTSQRMRLAAKLKMEVHKEIMDESATMWQIMSPKFFDDVCMSAIKCCIPFSDDIEDLSSPSNALKLKYDVKRLINAKWAFAIKKGDEEAEKECQKFVQLMDIEWGEKVTKLARMVLDQRRYEETKELPAPGDVKQLTAYLIQQIKQTPLSAGNFWRLIPLLQTRIMLYNKRRSGEIEVIK